MGFSAVFLLLFLFATFLVLTHRTVGPDRAIAGLFVGLSRSVYFFFGLLCRTGNVEIEGPIFLLLSVGVWRKSPSVRPALLFIGTVFVLGTALEHLLKTHLPAYAPLEAYRHDPFPGWSVFFPLHLHIVASFPSGHTFRALLILLWVSLFAPAFRGPVLLWAAGIMAGVIILGWHWSSDVLGSLALAGIVWPWGRLLSGQIKKT